MQDLFLEPCVVACLESTVTARNQGDSCYSSSLLYSYATVFPPVMEHQIGNFSKHKMAVMNQMGIRTLYSNEQHYQQQQNGDEIFEYSGSLNKTNDAFILTDPSCSSFSNITNHSYLALSFTGGQQWRDMYGSYQNYASN